MLTKPQYLVYWLGALRGQGGIADHNDSKLDPELAEIIQCWRVHYTVRRPKNQDVKYTLEDLIACDDDGIRNAVRVMEPFTDAWLATGALRLWRQENPKEIPPTDWFKLDRWPPERIRAAARAALDCLPGKNGRPSTFQTDLNFAKALVRYWYAKKGLEPTITDTREATKESDFLQWAEDMFLRSGRKNPEFNRLASILRKAKKLEFPENGKK